MKTKKGLHFKLRPVNTGCLLSLGGHVHCLAWRDGLLWCRPQFLAHKFIGQDQNNRSSASARNVMLRRGVVFFVLERDFTHNRSAVEWISVCYWSGRLAFDTRSGQTKDYKNWYSQLSCLMFSIKKDSAKPPPCVANRWAGGSLTGRPKGPFTVSGPR